MEGNFVDVEKFHSEVRELRGGTGKGDGPEPFLFCDEQPFVHAAHADGTGFRDSLKARRSSLVMPPAIWGGLWRKSVVLWEPSQPLEYNSAYRDIRDKTSGVIELGGNSREVNFQWQASLVGGGGLVDQTASGGTDVTAFLRLSSQDGLDVVSSAHTATHEGDCDLFLGSFATKARGCKGVFSDETGDFRDDIEQKIGHKIYTTAHFLVAFTVGDGHLDCDEARDFFQRYLLPNYNKLPYINSVSFDQTLRWIKRCGFEIPRKKW